MKTRLFVAAMVMLMVLLFSVAVFAQGEGVVGQEVVLEGNQVGVFEVNTPKHGSFLVTGESVALIFNDEARSMYWDQKGWENGTWVPDLYFWLGGVSHKWSELFFRNPKEAFYERNEDSTYRYGVIVRASDGDCGITVATLQFRPALGMKRSYTNVVLGKYSKGESIPVFLENNDLATPSEAAMVALESSGHSYIEFGLPEDSELQCTDVGLYLQGQRIMSFHQVPRDDMKACFVSLHGRTAFQPVAGGEVLVEIRPRLEMIPETFYEGTNLSVIALNPLTPRWCGGPR